VIEKLESRRLLSSGLTATQSGTTLDVVGGADGSKIVVREDNQNVLVHDNVTGTDQTFAGITAINIVSQAKDDSIFYTGNTIGAQIDAGGGNDTVTIDDTGTGSSYASGGGGDDTLTVIHSHRTTVAGGGGGDSLFLNTASDVTSDSEVWAYGNGGSDTFVISGGTVHTDATKQDSVVEAP